VMKTNNFTYTTQEQQDDYIQSLSVSDIKNVFVGNSILVGKAGTEIEEECFDTDFEIQNLSMSELKELSKPKKQTFSIQYKIAHTGLDANTILLIETNKYRATLHELMLYCKGLNISYRNFLPELFKTENI
jgi:hypothetical protein